jgi:hypothetical protein
VHSDASPIFCDSDTGGICSFKEGVVFKIFSKILSPHRRKTGPGLMEERRVHHWIALVSTQLRGR